MGDFDQAKYIQQYQRDNYDRVNIQVPKGIREEWKKIASSQGKSLNAFIVDAVEERIQNLKGES